MSHSSALFFQAGGTLSPDQPSYIYRKCDQDLLFALTDGDFCFVLDSRQKGKSSLLAQTISVLTAQGAKVAKLDLQRIGSNLTVDQWYAGLVDSLSRSLSRGPELLRMWGKEPTLGPHSRWMNVLESLVAEGDEIYIFVDEVDFVRALPFTTDEFFAGLRELYNRRSTDRSYGLLRVCLAGTASPSQLISNNQVTPFNVGKSLTLTDFDRESICPYEALLTQDPLLGQALADRIFYWTGGHPYLTQSLCLDVIEGRIDSPADFDRRVRERFLSASSLQSEGNLMDVSRRVLEYTAPGLDPQESRSQLLTAYQRIRSGGLTLNQDNEWIITALRLAGLISVEGAQAVPRCRIYREVFSAEWINRSMPNAEIRRRKAAVRAAIVRTSLIGGGVAIALAAAAVYAFVISRQVSLERDRVLRKSYAASMVLAGYSLAEGDLRTVEESVAQTRTNPYKGWEWHFWQERTNRNVIPPRSEGPLEHRFSRDSRRILGRYPDEIVCRDAESLQVLWTIGSQVDGRGVVFELSDDRILDLSFDGSLKIWDAKSRRLLTQAKTPGILTRHNGMVDTSGRYVSNFTMQSWWVYDTKELKLYQGKSQLIRPAFGPNGAWLVGYVDLNPRGQNRHLIKIVDWRTGRSLAEATTTADVANFCPDPKGRWIALSRTSGVVDFLDPRNLRLIYRRRISPNKLWRMSVSQDGEKLSVDDLVGQAFVVTTRDYGGTILGKTEGLADSVISPDGRMLLSKSSNDYLFDIDRDLAPARSLKKGARVLRIFPSGIAAVQDGERIYQVKVEDPAKPVSKSIVVGAGEIPDTLDYVVAKKTGDSIISLESFEQTSARGALANEALGGTLLNKEGPFVFECADGKLRLFDPGTGSWRPALEQVVEYGRALTGSRVVFGRSAKLKMMVIDLGTGRVTEKRLPWSVHVPLLAPDHKSFYLAEEFGQVTLRDLKTLETVRTFFGHPGSVSSISLSPDGTRLASGSTDTSVRIWDTETGDCVSILHGHKTDIRCLQWLADGKTLVSGDTSGQIRIWRAEGYDPRRRPE